MTEEPTGDTVDVDHAPATIEAPTIDAPTIEAPTIEVRRNGVVAGAVGIAAAAVCVAYLRRSLETGTALDWAFSGGLALVALLHLAALVDARTPLLVADAQGVRLRLGSSWAGLPWSGVASVEHLPRRGMLRDARLVVVPLDPEILLSGLDSRGRRQAALARRLYGLPWAVPLGLGTTVSDGSARLVERITALSSGAAPVMDSGVGPSRAATPDPHSEPVSQPGSPRTRWRDPRPVLASGIGSLAGRVRTAPSAQGAGLVGSTASATPSPLRETHAARRSDLTLGALALDLGEETAPIELPELDHLRRPDFVDQADLQQDPAGVPEPEADEPTVVVARPVVGPILTRARVRLSLTVDELAERTRIRSHVIEAIEVDDFAACGGDFYARGHLRTLARVLGVDSAPVLAAYDQTYATAPVSPRRVFEADLATSPAGAIRATKGGPNWSVLVAAVMAVVLAWSVARLVTDGPVDVRQLPGLQAGSGGVHRTGPTGAPVPVLVRAAGGGARVVVRDGDGRITFSGELAFGESRSVKVVPPVRVESSDGSVELVVNGVEQGALGEIGRPASGTFSGE